eukprot:Blabericola_migrator_1__7914@NODE_4051_length_1357_cov_5_449612_g2500_i0_p1_GENE_NODE_4051_length_1357_cov_5_449612_g2500_i0NODE_4051_length_1357_cov_5_449612_g2500_i0_p1_ORF_typecomplete_len105_score11_13Phage_cap_P2/PF05125_12/0_29_NODE_4051_length_1357_cov_5_449612_g2500_i0618932
MRERRTTQPQKTQLKYRLGVFKNVESSSRLLTSVQCLPAGAEELSLCRSSRRTYTTRLELLTTTLINLSLLMQKEDARRVISSPKHLYNVSSSILHSPACLQKS